MGDKLANPGVYTIYERKKQFPLHVEDDNGNVLIHARFWYASHLKTSYNTPSNYIHSTAFDYDDTSGPNKETDARLGKNITNGCTRISLEAAKYIYDNCGNGTTVIIRNK